MKMSEYSIKVFKDPKMLQSKLDLYLQSSPEKVEIYANACERFFYLGGKRILKFDPTWSWWGFFEGFFFFLYRKNYIEALVLFICSIFLSWIPLLIWVVCGVFAKYSVCMNFLKCLEMQDDEMLSIQGGTNDWVIYIAIIFIVAVFSIGIFAAL